MENKQIQPQPMLDEFSHKNWRFSFTKSTISPSTLLSDFQSKYSLQKIPDSVFGSNSVKIHHIPTTLTYTLNIENMLHLMNFAEIDKKFKEQNLLDSVKFKFSDVQVFIAKEWKEKQLDEKEIDGEKIKKLDKISDVFFSSAYRGEWSINNKNIEQPKWHEREKDNKKEVILYDRLTPDNPILFSNNVQFFEDEIGDNGIVFCQCRFRVMDDCFLLLFRNYLRVDKVLVRIIDTRIFHSFGQKFVVREFIVKESSWKEINNSGFKITTEWMNSEIQDFQVEKNLKEIYSFNDVIEIP